jgi:hypothetical protein
MQDTPMGTQGAFEQSSREMSVVIDTGAPGTSGITREELVHGRKLQ